MALVRHPDDEHSGGDHLAFRTIRQFTCHRCGCVEVYSVEQQRWAWCQDILRLNANPDEAVCHDCRVKSWLESQSVESPEQRAEALEAGALIIADLSQQRPNGSYDPPVVYRDLDFTCRDCGMIETWTAKRQQWWYEVAKGAVQSRAVRCHECREKRRKYKGLAPKTIAEIEAREHALEPNEDPSL